MRRFLALWAVALGAVLFGASTASAATPAKDVFFDSFSFEDTWTCPGVTIVQSNVERDTVIEFSSTRLRIQRHGVATLTANGKTLTSNFSASIWIDLDLEQTKVTGTVYDIQVPGKGHVLLDAGNVVFDDSTGAVVHLAGPHQQLTGDVGDLCNYLAP